MLRENSKKRGTFSILSRFSREGLCTVRVVAAFILFVSVAPAWAQPVGNQWTPSDTARLEQIETELRGLTGRMEEIAHEIHVLREQFQRLQMGSRGRFESSAYDEGQQAASPSTSSFSQKAQKGSSSPGGGEPPQSLDQFLASPSSQGEGAVSPTGTATGRESKQNASVLSESTAPLDLSHFLEEDSNPHFSLETDATNQAQGVPPSFLAPPPQQQGHRSDFVQKIPEGASSADPLEQGRMALQQGDFMRAQTLFQSILAQGSSSNSVRISALYGLGRSALALESYRQAADAFLKVYTTAPSAPEAAESLFFLAQSLERMKETKAACASYQQFLKKYPSAFPDQRSTAKAAQSKLGCKVL